MNCQKCVACIVAFSVSLIAVGCNDSNEFGNASDPPTPSATPQADAGSSDLPSSQATSGKENTAENSATVIDNVELNVPAGWDNVGPEPRQLGFISGRILIPSGDQQAELIISSTGGGIDANLKRWVGQFQMAEGASPKREKMTIDGHDGDWMELSGTYNARSFGKSGPHENWAVIGIGIARDEHDFYLKLNGPKETVDAIRDDFRTFVTTAKFKK